VPTFSADWFSRNIDDWKDLFRQVSWDRRAPKTVVEVGSFEGRSTLWILDHLLQHPRSRIHCIDLFAPTAHNPDPRQTFVANLGPRAPKVDIMDGRSFDALARLYTAGVRCDFAYIDGSHYGADVLDDLVMSFKVARVGGLIVCDDYLWSMEASGREDVLNSPKIAVDAFTTIVRRKIDIIPRPSRHQVAFIKTRD
jgi:predicted O-methyltransferase YrrM